MTTLQQQIQQLAVQLQQLASRVEEPVEQKDIDFEKLVLEAKQHPLQYHPVKKYDEYIKTLYLQKLLSIVAHTEYEQEERYRLIARIFTGIEMQEEFTIYLHKSRIMTVEQLSHFSQILQENKLIKSFLIDALMILGIQQEKKASKYIAEIAAVLNVDETDFKTVCQLVVAILQVNHENIASIIEKSLYLRFAAVHYLQAIQSPYSPVLFVIGTGTEKIKAKNLKDKTSIHLENVCILLDEAMELESLEKVYLKNCKIESEMLSLKLEMIDDICFENVNFENIKKIEQVTILDCPSVTFKGVQVKNCSVYNQHLFNIQNTSLLSVTNNYFEKIKLYVYITYEKESLIKIENVKQLQESHNTNKNCEVFWQINFHYFSRSNSKRHTIEKIISNS